MSDYTVTLKDGETATVGVATSPDYYNVGVSSTRDAYTLDIGTQGPQGLRGYTGSAGGGAANTGTVTFDGNKISTSNTDAPLEWSISNNYMNFITNSYVQFMYNANAAVAGDYANGTVWAYVWPEQFVAEVYSNAGTLRSGLYVGSGGTNTVSIFSEANGYTFNANGSIGFPDGTYQHTAMQIGYTGSTGGTGYTGSIGSIGYTGSAGSQGTIGYTGSAGGQGTTGYTGSVGSQGTIGYTGSAGSTGSQGTTGYTGSSGSQGSIGYTGSAGSQGNIGYTGSQGATGYTGSIPATLVINKSNEQFTPYASVNGVFTFDCSNGYIFNATSLTAGFTPSFSNFDLANNTATSITMILTQGGTAYAPTSNVQLGSTTNTAVSWQGGSVPTGNANKKDVLVYSVLNSSGTYTVLGQLVSFG